MLRAVSGVLLFALIALIAVAPAKSQQKATVEELHDEIAKLEARLTELRADLAKFRKRPANRPKYKPAGTGFRPATFAVGTGGVLLDSVVRVENILNADEMIVTQTNAGPLVPFIVRQSTAGLADGKLIDLKGIYEVVETKKPLPTSKRVYYVVEPVEK
jgi:hypothetical protein